jgi:N6-L-threonylcarbamoyladenine synthase
MIVLGIETSCDETALALIETRMNSGVFECRIISSLIHSQAELHSPYGGVFPTLAKREHEKYLPILLEKITVDAKAHGIKKDQINAIAVTEGPGLEPALWSGIVFSEQLSKELNVPVIPVNHMEGHVVGSLLKSDIANGEWQTLKSLPAPALALLISGGHTELVSVNGNIENKLEYKIIGQTKDDAVGEAFDKVARLLGLPYPGGPHISNLAHEAREKNIVSPVKLPRPMIHSKDMDFSFSGLKTAVLYAVRDQEKITSMNNETTASSGASVSFSNEFKLGIAREFEESITETLDTKLRKATEETGAQSVIIGGGVAANAYLRAQFEKTTDEYGVTLFLPSKHISGDNALMIALAGALANKNLGAKNHSPKIRAHGTKKLGL